MDSNLIDQGDLRMNLGIIISNKDPEIMWNAIRFANLCLNNHDEVSLFLNAHAVAYHEVDSPQYKLEELLKTFALSDGVLLV
jgi:uncharacterized protein involved in oxidation of intracellular sulfur